MTARPARVRIAALFMLASTLILSRPAFAEDGLPVFELESAVGVWLLDEGGGEVAKDTSASGNDGR